MCAACGRGLVPVSNERVQVLVIAPHPDDEVLLAAGVLQQAVARRQRVAVVVVTNGDLTCERDGALRQTETVAALARLGVEERDVHFLGYPDGYLSALGTEPLPPLERRAPDGRCVKATGTWATRGAGAVDVHTARTGRPGAYLAESLTGDLAALLSRLRPREVYLPHGIDQHPDHAATYAYFRRALERLQLPPLDVFRAVIHATDACWPGACEAPMQLDAGIPPLPAPLGGYAARARRPIDAQHKLEAISEFRSQFERPLKAEWLSAFARPEEVFFPERLARSPSGRWLREPTSEHAVRELEIWPTPEDEVGGLTFVVTTDGVMLLVSRRQVAWWPRARGASNAL
ncbi:MAG: PIG-L family deacetylase, partial [Archangium sp.]|nr:PIG-L family deacetylase [Archangium sp.]